MVAKCQVVEQIEAATQDESTSEPERAGIATEDDALLVLRTDIDIVVCGNQNATAHVVPGAALDDRTCLGWGFIIFTVAIADDRVAIIAVAVIQVDVFIFHIVCAHRLMLLILTGLLDGSSLSTLPGNIKHKLLLTPPFPRAVPRRTNSTSSPKSHIFLCRVCSIQSIIADASSLPYMFLNLNY